VEQSVNLGNLTDYIGRASAGTFLIAYFLSTIYY